MNNQRRAENAGNAQDDAGQAASNLAAFAETAKRVGEQLAALRQGRGLSIEDISARLKVSPAKLKALEAGTWNALPEMPFIQGVVRGYARMLDADPAPLIEVLRPFGRRAPIDLPPSSSNAPSIPRSPVHFRSPAGNGAVISRWVWGAGVVIVVGLAAWWFSSHRTSAPSVTLLDAASVPAAQTAGSAACTPNAEDQAGGASATAAYQPPAAQPASAATASEPVAMAAALPQPAAGAAPASASTTVAAAGGATREGEAKLHLQLSGDSWVEVRGSNGKVLLSQLLKAGASQDVAGPAPLKVVIGNVAGVVALQFNGQPVELKSRGAGNVARLTLQ